jgi:hypothetical protein
MKALPLHMLPRMKHQQVMPSCSWYPAQEVVVHYAQFCRAQAGMNDQEIKQHNIMQGCASRRRQSLLQLGSWLIADIAAWHALSLHASAATGAA